MASNNTPRYYLVLERNTQPRLDYVKSCPDWPLFLLEDQMRAVVSTFLGLARWQPHPPKLLQSRHRPSQRTSRVVQRRQSSWRAKAAAGAGIASDG
jgi:hypothetical protein